MDYAAMFVSVFMCSSLKTSPRPLSIINQLPFLVHFFSNEGLKTRNLANLVKWTPLAFAAGGGQTEIMSLLKEKQVKTLNHQVSLVLNLKVQCSRGFKSQIKGLSAQSSPCGCVGSLQVLRLPPTT